MERGFAAPKKGISYTIQLMVGNAFMFIVISHVEEDGIEHFL